MAEPPDPQTTGSPAADPGEKDRIDRARTPLAGQQKINYAAVSVLLGAGLLFVLWGAGLFRTEPPEPPPQPARLQARPAPEIPPQPPEPTVETTPPPPSAPALPPFDEMAAERERLLLLRVQGLQKQLLERRRSKMLVVSDPAAPATSPAADTAAGPGRLTLAADDPNALRAGDVGPVLEQEAVPARLLRTTAYTITEGTVIPAILETAIHSQLPGLVRAVNSADVYSHDGSQLLIPKGSRLVGRYQSDIRRGQVRVFILWTRILRADGLSVLINSPGTDPLGRAGLAGDVDTHFFQIFGAAILLSVLDTGLDIGLEMAREQGTNNTNIGQGSFNGSGLDRAGELALQDSLQIQPTIHIDQGTRISIMVARDLDFEAVEMQRAAGQGE